jgi:hypothetical protein
MDADGLAGTGGQDAGASASHDDTVRLWDATTGAHQQTGGSVPDGNPRFRRWVIIICPLFQIALIPYTEPSIRALPANRAVVDSFLPASPACVERPSAPRDKAAQTYRT